MKNYGERQIEIRVKLYANLRKYLPTEGYSAEDKQAFQEGLTVGGLLKAMKIPPEEIMAVFVNSIMVESDEEIHDGDEVDIFPPIGGG